MVACLVDRGDPATELGRGALQQGQPVSAERNGKILKSVLLVSREAGRQIGLMLAKNVHREESPVADSRPVALPSLVQTRSMQGSSETDVSEFMVAPKSSPLPFGCDDGDAGCKGSHHRPELLGINGDTAQNRASVSLP